MAETKPPYRCLMMYLLMDYAVVLGMIFVFILLSLCQRCMFSLLTASKCANTHDDS